MSETYNRTPLVVQASAAKTATYQTTAQSVGNGDALFLFVDVTAVSGTTPSLTVNVEWSHDGTNWFTTDPTTDAFAALTAAGKKVKRLNVSGTYFRLNCTISGTTPSFTFAVTAILGS